MYFINWILSKQKWFHWTFLQIREYEGIPQNQGLARFQDYRGIKKIPVDLIPSGVLRGSMWRHKDSPEVKLFEEYGRQK